MKIGDEIIQILDYLCDKFGIATDWTNVNVLPYLENVMQKYINWEIHTSIAFICIEVFVIIASIFYYIFSKDWGFHDDDGKFENMNNIKTMIFVVIVIGCVILIMTEIFDIIECRTFPEKAVYDYLYQNWHDIQ